VSVLLSLSCYTIDEIRPTNVTLFALILWFTVRCAAVMDTDRRENVRRNISHRRRNVPPYDRWNTGPTGSNRFGTLAVHGTAAIRSAERGERTRAWFSAIVEIPSRVYRGSERGAPQSLRLRDSATIAENR